MIQNSLLRDGRKGYHFYTVSRGYFWSNEKVNKEMQIIKHLSIDYTKYLLHFKNIQIGLFCKPFGNIKASIIWWV